MSLSADKFEKLSGDRPFNNLLRVLQEKDYALIAPQLELRHTSPKELLYNPGDNVGIVYSLCDASLVTLLVTSEDGHEVEAILIGKEGAVGGIVSCGNLPAYCHIIDKNGDPFASLRVQNLEAAKAKSAALRHMFARYADCLLAQVFQSSACNAIHSIEQRCAKWIIATMERTGSHVLCLTQEQLAGTLGVDRSYASRVIQAYRSEGILEIRRGSIVVRDIAALEARSCHCNESIKRHFDEVLRGVYPDESWTD